MQAIPTFDTCLVCHRADLDPEVERVVRALYPDDETTGYAVGDVRGAFSLYKPIPEAAEVESIVPEARPKPLLERLGYTPRRRPGDAAGLPGDPGTGAVVFARQCQHCHAPDDLARHLFPPEGPAAERDLCLFLETHGLAGQPSACDVVAFLQDLALFLAETGANPARGK
jgi:hypothetical protein